MIDDFKGLYIPREIMLCSALTLVEKNLVAQVEALNNGGKGCTAGNKYFAELFGLSEVRIRHVISDLLKKGCLKMVKNDRSKALVYDPNWSKMTEKTVKNDQELVKNDQDTYMKAKLNQSENKERVLEKIEITARALIDAGKWRGQIEQIIAQLKPQKEKKSRKKEILPSEIIFPFPDSFDFMQAWEAWLALRRRKHWVTDATWQQGALAYYDRKAEHNEQAYVEALNAATAAGWQSIHPETILARLKKEQNQSNNGQKKYSASKLADAIDALYPNQ